MRVIVQDASPGRSGGMVGEMGRSEKSDSCTKDAVVEGKMFHIYRRDGVCLLYTSDAADDRPRV